MRHAHSPRRPASIAPAPISVLILIMGLAVVSNVPPASAHEPGDTLQFEPVSPAEEEVPQSSHADRHSRWERAWLQDPFHRHLLCHNRHVVYDDHGFSDWDGVLDYNRVDELRFGASTQAQGRWGFAPRFAAQLSYATGRRRWLYGAQLEQPLDRANHFGIGVSMSRATDHLDLNQVDDFENSMALLFGRQDYRDYFEREGVDAYLAARWPGVTTLSTHLRNDQYRSLAALDVRSWFHTRRTLRGNPAIDEGEIHALALRLERHTRRSAGLYHWVEFENAGHGMGGDFEYQRALADLRTVLRLSPGTRLTLRAVGGSGISGQLPPQRTFTIGGVDGLRAHSFGAFRGDQVALGQAEYTIGFGGLGRSERVDLGGLHAIVFVDAGNAWTNAHHEWDPNRQHFALDGGFGLGTDEDDLRIYFARDLRDPNSDFVISARLQRPF